MDEVMGNSLQFSKVCLHLHTCKLVKNKTERSFPDVQNIWTTCFNNLRADTSPARCERSQTHPGVGGKSKSQKEFWG